MVADRNFKGASNNLPKKIEATLDLPKVREMILAAGEKSVQGFIEFELINLAERINVSGNLTPAQIEFIAKQLINKFPNETIADFKICFERAAMGAYGKIFKLDGMEVGIWMSGVKDADGNVKQIGYLDEKYQVMEKQLMKEKEDLYKRPENKPGFWLEVWKEAVEKTDKEGGGKTTSRNIAYLNHLTAMTEPEWTREGQEKPIRKVPQTGFNDPEVVAMQIARQKLQRAASEFYKGRYSFNLQKFEVEGIEFMAENESDAEAIYKLATEK